MLQMLRGRGLRLSVSAVALLSMSVQPVLAQGRNDSVLNACGTERAGLVKLDKDYKDLKRSKMANAVGEGVKQGAMVLAKGVMSGGIPVGGRGGGGFGSAMGGMSGLMGAVGGMAMQSAAAQQAQQPGGQPQASQQVAMFGQDMLSGAMGLQIPGVSIFGGFGVGGGGDNVKAYAALAVLVAIVATADAYAKLKEQEAGGDLKKASFNIDQDAARQLTVSRQIVTDGESLVDCRARQLSDINTRLASAANDKDRKAIRRERTDLVSALKKDIDLTGDVVDQHTGMAKTFTQGRAMTDGASEADVLGGQAPAYATVADTTRKSMPKAGGAPAGQQQAAAPPPPPPPSALVAIKATVVRSAPVASASVVTSLPVGREIRPKTGEPDGGWWEIDVAGAPGYVRASDVGPPGSVPVQTAAAKGAPAKGAARGKGAVQAKAPPPPPAPAGPTNIRAYNQSIIAARDTGKGRLASLMTDIQTSQRRENVFYAWLERLPWS
ncbi:MAG: SH3 domain-containing protein [Phenylobacterium sp.]|nr:SH3 domain-containing protein [Phenylobacterium sp.]